MDTVEDNEGRGISATRHLTSTSFLGTSKDPKVLAFVGNMRHKYVQHNYWISYHPMWADWFSPTSVYRCPVICIPHRDHAVRVDLLRMEYSVDGPTLKHGETRWFCTAEEAIAAAYLKGGNYSDQ